MSGIVRQHSVKGLGMPPQEAIEVARRMLTAEGFQSVAVGPTAATFVRTVRPRAVTIAAMAFAVPTLGLSLLALLIRSQEQCAVTSEVTRRGTALSLSGDLTTMILHNVEAALRQSSGPVSTDGYESTFPVPDSPFPPSGGAFPASGRTRERPMSANGLPQPATPPSPRGTPYPPSAPLPPSPSSLQPASPVPQPASPGPPARSPLPARETVDASGPGPVEGPLRRSRRRPESSFPKDVADLASGADEGLTVVWPSATTPAPRWVLTLDDGRAIDVAEFNLIGRDPEPTEDDPATELISLIDPEMSVSKTHAAFGIDGETLWFLDRYSTNGTSMVPPGVDRVALEPGVRTPIEPGSEVWIGRRQLRVDVAPS